MEHEWQTARPGYYDGVFCCLNCGIVSTRQSRKSPHCPPWGLKTSVGKQENTDDLEELRLWIKNSQGLADMHGYTVMASKLLWCEKLVQRMIQKQEGP